MPLSYRPDALWASISSAKNTQILRLDALDQLPENLFFVPILPMASLNHIILVDAGSHGLRVWVGVGKIRSAWGERHAERFTSPGQGPRSDCLLQTGAPLF